MLRQLTVVAALALLALPLASAQTARPIRATRVRALGLEVPDAQGNFFWLPAGPRTQAYADHFAAGGVMGRAYVSGEPGDGVRITVGEPAANERVVALAASLPGRG